MTITSDALFILQLIGATLFIRFQYKKMKHSVQGVSALWLSCAEVFALINFGLAISGWLATPNRGTIQLVVTHGAWTFGIIPLLWLLFLKRKQLVWEWYDSFALALIILSTITTFTIAGGYDLGITDPIVRGTLAGIFRGIPHLCMVVKIWKHGNKGVSQVTVWTANVTGLARIGQLMFTISEVGFDRLRTGLAIGEAANQLTWMLVTAVWLWRQKKELAPKTVEA